MKKFKMKRIISLFVVAIVTIVSFSSLSYVKANGSTLTFNFSVKEGVDVTLAARGSDNSVLGLNTEGVGLYGVTKDNENQDVTHFIDIKNGANNFIAESNVSVTCSSSTSCTVTISNETGVRFVTGGDTPFRFFIGNNEYNFSNTLLTANENLVVREKEQSNVVYEGDAYVVWECNDGSSCMYLINGIDNTNGTAYYNASTIVDTRTNETFNAFNENKIKGFVIKAALTNWENNYKAAKNVTTVDYSNVDPDLILRGTDATPIEEAALNAGVCTKNVDRPEFEACVEQYARDNNIEFIKGVGLQPLPDEPKGNNSYTSYGDRNFKVTIYNDEFAGISLGDLSSLTYVPNYYSEQTRVDSVDVSDTSINNPAIINSVLLERSLTIKEKNINGFSIESIKALNVPEGAVTITENNNEWSLVFNSNYYDNVVFEITDSNSNKYYFKVERKNINSNIRHNSIDVEFYFDSNTSYSNYELVATYVYKDGTEEIKNMSNTGRIDDGFGNITFDNEADGGRRLKKATYAISEENGFIDNVKYIYLNIKKSGSTDSMYAGTLAGSGKGILLYEAEEMM